MHRGDAAVTTVITGRDYDRTRYNLGRIFPAWKDGPISVVEVCDGQHWLGKQNGPQQFRNAAELTNHVMCFGYVRYCLTIAGVCVSADVSAEELQRDIPPFERPRPSSSDRRKSHRN